MKDRLFISYRRRQDAWAVGHLRDRLVGEFGREQVFFDTESLQGGQQWLGEIRAAIADASAVVVVFDQAWVGRQPDGTRRIDQPDDPVRQELRLAHQQGVAIVPVVIDQSAVPGDADLPEDLRFLSTLHFRRLNPTDSIDHQVNALIGDIRLAIHGLRPWMRVAAQALWMGALAAALALGLQRLGLVAPFVDAFTATVQTLRLATGSPPPAGLVLVEINDGEFRELFSGRLPLEPVVMAIALDSLARQSQAAGSCQADRPVGINLDLSPGEAHANHPGSRQLEAALARLVACRPVVLACPQSIERRSATTQDLAWRHRLAEPASGRGVAFASSMVDPAVLHHSTGRGELGVMLGDLARGRAEPRDAAAQAGRRCACPADEATMRQCDGSLPAVAAANAWDRQSMLVPFATAGLRYSLAEALVAEPSVAAQPVLVLGSSFGTQGRYPVNGLAEAAQRGVTGSTVQAFMAASVLHHDPVRGPAGAAAAATLLAAALTCLALTGCWWRVSRLAHRFSRRAPWYGLALVVALGMPLACVALAVRWPAACALAAGLALACMLATARSAVAGNELLLHGGVAWKTPRGLWRALSNEADRASALMRLAIFGLEALIIISGLVLVAAPEMG